MLTHRTHISPPKFPNRTHAGRGRKGHRREGPERDPGRRDRKGHREEGPKGAPGERGRKGQPGREGRKKATKSN